MMKLEHNLPMRLRKKIAAPKRNVEKESKILVSVHKFGFCIVVENVEKKTEFYYSILFVSLGTVNTASVKRSVT